jgi:hypothetical protein
MPSAHGTAARPKVFGIGYNKTGTTTLGVCMQTLGYRHTSANLELTKCVARGDLETVFRHAELFESFEDWPWPLVYRELDQRFPGSKFILTVRMSSEAWIRSLAKHALLSGPTEFRRIAYGYSLPDGHEDEHIARYEFHNRTVREYFSGRAADFLEVCWETGTGWKELAAFLGVDAPAVPLPHANRSARKKRRLALAAARRLLSSVLPERRRGARDAGSHLDPNA